MRQLLLSFLILSLATPTLAAEFNYQEGESRLVGGRNVLVKPPQEEKAPDSKPQEEIGFDANVKRDPNGNPIIDDPAAEAPKPYYGLRTDRGMRSDKDLLKHK